MTVVTFALPWHARGPSSCHHSFRSRSRFAYATPNNVGFSSWNFSYFAGNIFNMPNTSSYLVSVDRDPGAGVTYIPWASFNGSGHDSSNEGFVAGFDPFAAGIYTIRLDEFNANGGLVNSVAINVDVTSTVTPEPASLALMATGLMVLGGAVRRRNRRNAAA